MSVSELLPVGGALFHFPHQRIREQDRLNSSSQQSSPESIQKQQEKHIPFSTEISSVLVGPKFSPIKTLYEPHHHGTARCYISQQQHPK